MCGIVSLYHLSFQSGELKKDTGVHTDPSHFWALSDGFTGEGASCVKIQLMQERGSMLWRIRWNIGSGIPILTLLAFDWKVAGSARTPHGSLRVNTIYGNLLKLLSGT